MKNIMEGVDNMEYLIGLGIILSAVILILLFTAVTSRRQQRTDERWARLNDEEAGYYQGGEK